MVQNVGQSALERLQSKKIERPTRAWSYMHTGAWGQPKVGKSDLILSARTSEVRTKAKTEPDGKFGMKVVEEGKVVIPSKPLRIAFANFDRSSDTVLAALPPDFEIYEERYFEDEDGLPIVDPTGQVYQAQLNRFRVQMRDVGELAREGFIDLFGLDGGTITWENIRELRLPAPEGKDPDGGVKHLPRQYAPANKEMRETVMQQLYSLQCNTVVTLEAGEVWTGQNKTAEDSSEPGGTKLKMDGWNKSLHYVDAEVKVHFRERPTANPAVLARQREVLFGPATIRPQLIGTYFKVAEREPGKPLPKSALAEIYERVFSAPLLRVQDRAVFAELEAEHGQLEW